MLMHPFPLNANDSLFLFKINKLHNLRYNDSKLAIIDDFAMLNIKISDITAHQGPTTK